MGCPMQTAINLTAGIRDTWFQMGTPFPGPSASNIFLPLACTDFYLGVQQGEGEEEQTGDLIMGLVSLTNTKQYTGRRDKEQRV